MKWAWSQSDRAKFESQFCCLTSYEISGKSLDFSQLLFLHPSMGIPPSTSQGCSVVSRGYLLYKEYLLLFSSERYFRSTTFSPKYYSKHTPIFTRCQLQWQTIIKLPSSTWIKLAVTLDRQIGMWLFPRLRSTQSGVMSLLTRQNQGQISILNMI